MTDAIQLDRDALTEYAEGRVSAVFGRRFARLDDLPRRVRMPRGRLLMLDRVTAIKAEPASRGAGVIWAETDLRPDSWFLDPGGRIPACLMAEMIQITCPLVTYLGFDLDGQGDRVLRVLELEATFHGPRPRAGETLRHEFGVNEHLDYVQHGDMLLVSGGGHIRTGDQTRVTISKLKAGVYGKPVDGPPATSTGVSWDPATAPLDESLPFTLPDTVTTQRRFSPDQVNAVIPRHDPMCMIREVTGFDPTGGPWHRGYLRAEYPVDPGDWYFDLHFPNDSCMPGCLMWQCGAQSLAFYLSALGCLDASKDWDIVPGHLYRSRFRGEATPRTKLMTCELFVSSVQDATVQADVLISLDGVRAAHFPGLAVRAVPREKPASPPRTGKPANHVLTGATGFIGSALALELLDRTDATLTCVARPRPGRTADDRIKTSLHQTASLFQREDLHDRIDARCRGIAGDVAEPACGVDPAELGAVGQVWHGAALLAFEDARKDEVFQQNIDGTRNVLDLARQAGAACFNYVSTAYVAGKRSGPIAEEPADESTECNNWYEASKVAAEALVRASGLPVVRILRPSIVIGHSRTLATTSASTIYSAARGLTLARRRLTETVGDVLATRPWRVDADPDAQLNLIPVDRVVAAAVRLALAEAPSGIYHLTNACNTSLRDILAALSEVTGIREPLFADAAARLSYVDRLISDHIATYQPYTKGAAKVFGMDRVRAQLDGQLLNFAMPRQVIADLLRWYVDRNRDNW